MLRSLVERSNGQEDKRRLILAAAVRVFARKGYHTCRVGDIAEEAGVAHGLLYHYFRSKEDVLDCVFRETWLDVVGAANRVEETDEPARERLTGIAKILLRAWKRDPELVTVVIREGLRSPDLQRRVAEIRQAFEAILTGWVLGQLSDSDDDVRRAEQALVEIVCSGLAATPQPVVA